MTRLVTALPVWDFLTESEETGAHTNAWAKAQAAFPDIAKPYTDDTGEVVLKGTFRLAVVEKPGLEYTTGKQLLAAFEFPSTSVYKTGSRVNFEIRSYPSKGQTLNTDGKVVNEDGTLADNNKD